MLRRGFVVIFELLVVVNYASLLKCHVCNSQLSSACLDPFNISETLQECERSSGGRFGGGGRLLDVVDIIMQAGEDDAASQPPHQGEESGPEESGREMVCQKIVVVVGNESITGRGCAPQLVDGMHPCDAVRLSAPGNVRHCVTCPHDACNAGTGVRLTPSAAIVGVVVAVTRALGGGGRATGSREQGGWGR